MLSAPWPFGQVGLPHPWRTPISGPSQPTLRDVAELAGVSTTTASNALNGRGRVDRLTRQRVTQAAVAIGYRGASGLQSPPAPSRPRTIGLGLPEVAGLDASVTAIDFHRRVSTAAGAAALDGRHALLLLPAARSPEDLARFGLDGAIISDPEVADRRLEMLDQLGIPVVTLDRDPARPDRRWWVKSDTEADLPVLLDHVAERGGRTIALLSSALTWGWIAAQEAAYDTWCARRRLQPLVVRATTETAARDASALLDREDHPDAVVSLSDMWIGALLGAAREHGIAIPGDLLVACAIDSFAASQADPPITAIDVRPELQARAAVEMLLARIDGRPTPETVTTPSELVVRASTGG